MLTNLHWKNTTNETIRKDNGNLPIVELLYKKTYAYVLENPRTFDWSKSYIHFDGAIT